MQTKWGDSSTALGELSDSSIRRVKHRTLALGCAMEQAPDRGVVPEHKKRKQEVDANAPTAVASASTAMVNTGTAAARHARIEFWKTILETPPIEVWARVTDIWTPWAGVLTWVSRMEDLINYTKRSDLDASIAVVGGSFSRQKDWWTALVLDRFLCAHRDAFWATMNVYHAFSFLDLTVRLGSGAQRTGSLLERVQRYERRVQLLCEAGDMLLTLKRGDEAVTSYKEAIRMTDVHLMKGTHEHLQYTARAHVGMGAYDVRFGVFAQGSAYLRTAWSGVEKMLEIWD